MKVFLKDKMSLRSEKKDTNHWGFAKDHTEIHPWLFKGHHEGKWCMSMRGERFLIYWSLTVITVIWRWICVV